MMLGYNYPPPLRYTKPRYLLIYIEDRLAYAAYRITYTRINGTCYTRSVAEEGILCQYDY